MVGEDHLAEDVTQDVFLHIQRSFASYDSERELGPWVFTIAANKVRDHWRSRAHRAGAREASFEGDGADDALPEPADTRRGPLPELLNDEVRAALEGAIQALPPILRETLVLRWYEELPFDAIGRMVDRNETAVRKRYSRALAAVRAILEKRLRPSQGGDA